MSDENGELQESYGISKYRGKVVSGPIIRTLIWLGVPPLINQLIVVAYNVADTYWLGLYSEVAVAVPRQVWPVIMLFQALLMALTAACLSVISQHVGAKNYREASLSASRFFTLSSAVGALLCILLFLLREVIFKWLVSTPQEIFEDTLKFSGVIAFDILFNYIVLTYTTLLQSVGDTRSPAIVNGFAVGVNIILDPFLVLGLGPFPRLGVIGAALTDVMGKIISVIALTYIIRRDYPDLHVSFTKNFNAKWMRLVLRIGLPVLALMLTNGFAFVFQLQIVNLLGIVAATAYSIGFVIVNVVDAVLWGLTGATAIMVGQNLGAENIERAKEVAYKSAIIVFTLIAIGSCITYPLKRSIANVFVDDQAMIAETERFLEVILPALPFFGLFMVAMSTGRGSGHTTFPTAIGIARLWGIRVGLGYFLAFIVGLGPFGAWLAIALSNYICGTIALLWIKYGRWAKAVIRKGPVIDS